MNRRDKRTEKSTTDLHRRRTTQHFNQNAELRGKLALAAKMAQHAQRLGLEGSDDERCVSDYD